MSHDSPQRKGVAIQESALAHRWLDGLKGVEVGPSSHNPFGLNTRNVGLKFEGYEQEQKNLTGEFAPLHIIAPADDIPLPDDSEDFILSSHVIEHCPNAIKTLIEWYRVIRRGGYLYMIVPFRDAAPTDKDRPLTEWGHLFDDYGNRVTEKDEPEANGIPFGYGHYHVFDINTMHAFVQNIFGDCLELADHQNQDDKVGNGFTLVYRKTRTFASSFPWRLTNGDRTEDVRQHILDAQRADTAEKIVIAANLVPFKDEGQLLRQQGCIAGICSLSDEGIVPLNICFADELLEPPGWNVEPKLLRSADVALRIRAKRKPFVADLFDIASEWALEKKIEWFVLTNSDIIFTDRILTEIRRCIAEGYDTVAISRNEVERIDPISGLVPGYLEVNGYDVFVCRTKWWRQNRNLFQQYVYGERAWDDAYAAIMACHSRFAMLYKDGLCFHVKHATDWLSGPFADYNMGIYTGIDKLYSDRYEAFIKEVIHTDKSLLNSDAIKKLLQKYFTITGQAGSMTSAQSSASRFVNIGMVTYNRLEFTGQAIAALIEHTSFPYVLTVVDNNSQDGTKDYLRELKSQGFIKNLILLDENVGVAKASNLAWSLEPAVAYYLKLDNDIVIQKPGWLGEMIKVVEAVTEAGAVGYNFETATYEAVTAYGVRFRPKSNGNLGGACILIPRRTHDLLGYWCEDYGLYGEEDADYGARIRLAGRYNIYMEDERIGLHLPAGRAAIIDNTFTARDGIEEKTHSEYRAWKDEARRLNVRSGRYIRNIECYTQRGSAVYLDSAFAVAWHDRQNIDAEVNEHPIEVIQSDSAKQTGCGTGNAPATIQSSKPKIGVLASAPLPCACPQLRLVSALTCLHEAGELEYVDVARMLENAPASFVEELAGMSALILQRSKIAFWPYGGLGPLLDETGTKLILEVDDAVMQVPKTNPLYEHFQSKQHEFEEYFRHADLITVSTPYLKEVYSHYNRNVVVLPNCIDTKIWKCGPPVATEARLPLKILFSGTPSHVEDFMVLGGAIRRILEEFQNDVELIIWGITIPEFSGHPRVRFIENYVEDYANYAISLTNLKADIGIVPLKENVFNSAKSAIKWLEYSACGIAGIFSNVGEYGSVVSHGKTGLMVENNEADWYAAIKELILNRQLRSSIARNAYNDVITKHTVAHNAYKWLEAYKLSGCISAGATHMSSCKSRISAAARFHQAGQYAEAEAMYRDILAAEPDNFDALHLLGVLAHQVGRLDEALGLLSKAVQKDKTNPSACISLGNTLTSLGRYSEASESYRRALELEPNNAGTHYNLGNVLHFLDLNDEAVECYRKALAIKPDFIEVHNHVGNALRKLGRLEEAEASFRLALGLNANLPEAHNNLGNVLMDLGRLDEAEASFRQALALKPDYLVAYSNMLFVQNYSVGHDSACHLDLARSYGRMVEKKATTRFTSWHCIQQPKPLRVGLVSGDFNNHPVGFFLENVLAHINTSRIELIAYATQRKCDDLTDRIMPFFSEWRQLEGLDDESAAHLIRNDCVHILIDLAGHTAYNRLPVFAWKPAQVQVSWLGYGSTTGVSEIDYILGNPYSTPAEESNHFTETIWQLPETSLCFSFPNVNLEVALLPALSNGFITFGCFNNLAKLNDEVLSVWARILTAVPTSRLFLKNKQLGESSVCKAIIARFAAYGISEDRLLLEGRSPRSEYLRAYNRVDIVLDPFPFPGGTTTVEGLWMGVPFITRQGDRFISHQGEMIACNTGLLSEWIAKDDDEYVAKAISFSSNLEYLAGLRTILRRHLHVSPLFDACRFARYFEKALCEMWDKFSVR